ncbi:J domain-containing protein [Sinomonas atrocyanea]|uniref:J domain-containing protein n=1 Tax=Sinomonas atrocyanea TaxID=37927 RepID=UPI003D9755D8
MHAKDLYSVLGIDREATGQEIRQAFRRLVRTLHPDHMDGSDADTERLRTVLEAYSVLGHPGRRAAYDQTLPREAPASPLGAAFPADPTGIWIRRPIPEEEDLLWLMFRWLSRP